MQYSELKQHIKDDVQVPDYYEQLLLHSNDILLDLALLGQVETAAQLGLTQSKLSTMKPLFIAFHNITEREQHTELSKEDAIAILNAKGE